MDDLLWEIMRFENGREKFRSCSLHHWVACFQQLSWVRMPLNGNENALRAIVYSIHPKFSSHITSCYLCHSNLLHVFNISNSEGTPASPKPETYTRTSTFTIGNQNKSVHYVLCIPFWCLFVFGVVWNWNQHVDFKFTATSGYHPVLESRVFQLLGPHWRPQIRGGPRALFVSS